jgi:2-polyprenyl-6-methoxyphenol hydroxylase-like FAD-dependent oxidoreductase
MRQENGPGGTTMEVRCCIAGGGPAGMMLGFLLARAGVDVLVLEKHADFLRDFRGDTVHPSTLEVMHELGLLEDFLQRPHQEVRQLSGHVGGEPVTIADLSHLPTRCPFIALMPQWDFLNFLAEHGQRYASFHVKMQAKVASLIEEGGHVVGLRAETPDGPLTVRSSLVVGCDGRHSTVRERAGLKIRDVGAPIDVLWMRLTRRPDDPEQPAGWFDRGRILVMIDRRDYWQCAFVIPKGGYEKVKQKGLEALRADIAAIAPFIRDRVGELRDWDDIKLLTVVVDRLRRWHRPGLLCIGDAAHAMSPVGGVGINLAIQDAVAAANVLAGPLRAGRVTTNDLWKVQRRRVWPTWGTQRLQVVVQDRVLRRVLRSQQRLSLPWALRLFRYLPILTRVPARLIGLGIRPEHVRSLDVGRTREPQMARAAPALTS